MKITNAIIENYALHAMICSNCYHKKERKRFPVELMGWQLVDTNGNPTNEPSYTNLLGVAFDIYKKAGEKKYIVAFRGTDSKFDYLTASFPITFFISPHYKSATKRVYKEFLKKLDQDAVVVVTGHSLGGGLALNTSLKHGKDAVVFDSSPRIFDGWGDKHKNAQRIGIYQNGEVLKKFRDVSTKYNNIVLPSNDYIADYNFGEISPHSSYELAKKFLDAVKAEPAYMKVHKAFFK
jgi:hypothetical protein